MTTDLLVFDNSTHDGCIDDSLERHCERMETMLDNRYLLAHHVRVFLNYRLQLSVLPAQSVDGDIHRTEVDRLS